MVWLEESDRDTPELATDGVSIMVSSDGGLGLAWHYVWEMGDTMIDRALAACENTVKVARYRAEHPGGMQAIERDVSAAQWRLKAALVESAEMLLRQARVNVGVTT